MPENSGPPSAPSAEETAGPSSGLAAGATAVAGRPGWVRRAKASHGALRRRIKANPAADLAYRIFIGVVGTAITLGGLALLPLPGPGWLIVFLGLGLLATEFTWAHRVLEFTKRQMSAWTRWMQRQAGMIKAVLAVGCLVVVAALLAGYVAWQGVPAWVPFLAP